MDIAIYVMAIAWFVFWAAMLMNAARAQKWGWFVVVLLVPPLAIVYLFVAHAPVRRHVRGGDRAQGRARRIVDRARR